MSAENVEVVRELYGALNRMDYAGLALLDPEVEWLGTAGGLREGDIARGPEEVVRFLLEDLEAWEEVWTEPQEFIDAGDHVVVLQHERRKGKGSGVEIEMDTASVLTLREGKVVRCVGYMDQAEALGSVGLKR